MSAEKDDLSGLTSLGAKKTEYGYRSPAFDMLEWFPNPKPGKAFLIHLEFEEFTSLCPKTGQPDFAVLTLDYVPRDRCVETKSLKLYLFAYRQEGAFMERITNTICDDLVAALDPVWLRVTMDFNPRGGIGLTCVAEHGKEPAGRSSTPYYVREQVGGVGLEVGFQTHAEIQAYLSPHARGKQ